MQTKKEWFEFLTNVSDSQVNVERTDTIGKRSGSMVLGYVIRTLSYMNDPKTLSSSKKEAEKVKEALKWAETSKGISKEDIGYWMDDDSFDGDWIPHNKLSARIYRKLFAGTIKYDWDVEKLIKWHGAIGQIIRGELSVPEIREMHKDFWYNNLKDVQKGRLMLYDISHAVIAAVSEDLWKKIEKQVLDTLSNVITTAEKLPDNDCFIQNYIVGRFAAIKPNIDLGKFPKEMANYLSRYSFWYPESVLSLLSDEDMIAFFDKLIPNLTGFTKDISFKPMADFLYYDYHGKEKRANVYKLRIIENHLKNKDDDNIEFVYKMNKTPYGEVGCKLSSACNALVNFCVEAENSGNISFEGVTYLLMDYFKLRRDKFDRLNNESEYLKTMDNVENSRKLEILDYIQGNSVIDVGSGSGILLNEIEKKYLDMKIIGTDISANVLDVLDKKKADENHKWEVKIHNFVDSKMDEPVDNIIFSSILHEIYSYTSYRGAKFQKESVRIALRNAWDSLNNGGRLIIRDGIKTKPEKGYLLFEKQSIREAFLKFVQDFKGDVNKHYEILRDPWYRPFERNKDYRFIHSDDINLLREFAYTYTWGPESYANEVQEQFGYFTLEEFKKELLSLDGAVIKTAQEYLEPGYVQHLKDDMEFVDKDYNPISFPCSNCIIVVEKEL